MQLEPIDAQPDRTRSKLKGKQPRTLYAQHGLSSVVVGLLFGLPAAHAMLASLGVFAAPAWLQPFLTPDSRWMTVFFFGMFAAFGCLSIYIGAVEYLQQTSRRRAASLRPEDIPFRDFGGELRRIAAEGSSSAMQSTVFALFMIIFLIPFHLALLPTAWGGPGHMPPGSWWVPMLVLPFLAPFDLAALWLAWTASRAWLQRICHGAGYLTLPRFPFRLGETLQLTWHSTRNHALRQPTFTLRCVQDEYGPRDYENEATLEAWLVWSRRYRLPEARSSHADEAPIAISIMLPDEPRLGTNFDGDNDCAARYWELLIESSARPVRYRAIFLLPIYATENQPRRSDSPQRV